MKNKTSMKYIYLMNERINVGAFLIFANQNKFHAL